MFYIVIGILLGIWLDQQLNIPNLQEKFAVLGTRYNNYLKSQEKDV